MRKKFRAYLVAGCLAASAMVAVPTQGDASTDLAAGAVVQGYSPKRTWIRAQYSSVWVHFRPVLNSAALEIKSAGSYIYTICNQFGEGRPWNLIYDHSSHRVGYTYEEYLTVPANHQECSNVGEATGEPTDGETWVHLFPRANWAHESIWPGHDIARLCTLGQVYDPSDGTTRLWDLFLDHNNKVAGFTWAYAVGPPYSAPTCG